MTKHEFRTRRLCDRLSGLLRSISAFMLAINVGCAGAQPTPTVSDEQPPQPLPMSATSTSEPMPTHIPAAEAATRERTIAEPRVMIVSFDGLRPDAISPTRTPNLQSLIEEGSSTLTGQAEFPCITLPNHASMVTGRSIFHHGVFFNTSVEGRITSTTIFDVAKAAGISRGFFVTKPKLNFLCAEDDADVRIVKTDVDAIADQTAQAIRANDLRLIFLHFGEPDGAGHAHGWMTPEYFEQVARADTAFGRILEALRERQFFDNTLIIVTADHGGHGRTHGFDIPEDRNVPFILRGPNIRAGRSLTEVRRPMDAAATALYVLGLPTGSAEDGHIAAEAFVEADAIPMDSVAMQNAYVSLCGPVPIALIAPALLLARFCQIRRRTRANR